MQNKYISYVFFIFAILFANMIIIVEYCKINLLDYVKLG